MINYLPLFIGVFLLQGANTQNDWVLKKDKENIQIYVKKVDGFNMKAFKGITVMETTVSSLLAVITDIPGFPNWAPKTKKAEILDQKGETQIIYYVLTEAPWPINDRDGIYTLLAQKDGDSGGVLVQTGCNPDFVPEKKGVVRIKYSRGYWKLIPLENNKVKVIYENHSEPGGNVPAWLTNTSVVDVPFTALKNIKKQVHLNKYKNKQFKFLR